MARYILIDNGTGYIFGDTADLPGWRESEQTMEAAARLLDDSIGAGERAYEALRSSPRDSSTGYHVYRADVRGSEAVPNIIDGQDQEMIEAVQRDCEYVGYVRCTAAA